MTTAVKGASLLGALIDGLDSDSFESTLYDWISACLPVDDVTILSYYSDRGPQILYASAKTPEVHARLETDYISGAYLVDPFFALFEERGPAGCHRLRDVAPDQFQRTEYYLRYYHRTTVIDEVAFVTYPARDVSVHLCVGRDAASGHQFSAREIAVLQNMSPVVCALMTRRWTVLRVERRPPDRDQHLPGELVRRLAETHGISLSSRQSEVALHILRGHSSDSIGLRLGISGQTVKVFRKQLYRRCGISSQAELFSLMLPLLAKIGN